MPGVNVSSKYPGIAKYRPLFLFVLRTLAIFMAFLLFKFIHRYFVESNELSISDYLKNLDVYLWMANAINYPSYLILTGLGHDVLIEGRVISILGNRGVEVQGPCMGFNVFSIFIALIIAYPTQSSFLQKGKFILVGIAGIHLLNILRVSALVINNKYKYELPLNHHDLYNILIYAFVCMVFYIWIKKYSRSSATVV